MKDFVSCARGACTGRLVCPEGLTQPNWLRFMMGINYSEDSVDNTLSENVDNNDDEELIFDDNSKIKEISINDKNKTVIKNFLDLWIKGNKPIVFKTIKEAIEINGEKQNYENDLNPQFDSFKKFIVNYCLIDSCLYKLLNYRGNTDDSWNSYILKYISTIIKEEYCPLADPPRKVNESSFIYAVHPNETLLLLSETADVSYIRDESLRLKTNNDTKNKIIANLMPETGLSYKCDETLFDSLEKKELSLLIKKFKNAGYRFSYVPEYQDSQFLPYNLFKDCKSLKTVILSDKVKLVENDGFIGCLGIKKLEVPYECIIEGIDNYQFKIVYRKPHGEVVLSDDLEGRQTSGSVIDFLNKKYIDEDDSDLDDKTEIDDLDDDKGIIFEPDSSDLNVPVEEDSQLIAKNDVLWCLKIMPIKKRSDALYYTFYGLPNSIEDVRCHEDGIAYIEDVGKYMEKTHPEYEGTNWTLILSEARQQLHKIFVVYTTWTDWKSSNNVKKQEAIEYLLRNGISKTNMMVSGRLLSGFTYLEIANKMNLKEDAIRTPGISHVFNLLYDFIISAV